MSRVLEILEMPLSATVFSSVPSPAMKPLEQAKHPIRSMIFSPDSCSQFVGIGIRGIGMDGPQDFIKANAMLHCQDKFRE